MKVNELQVLARSLGIKSFGKNKAELIKQIQREQGNFDCFGSAVDYCDQFDCLFRSACLPERH
jgi:predicted metal-binding transcription factor (methanogenesis marker protein 9)